MTAPVVSIEPDATLLQAASLMQKHRVSGLPVTDAGRVVGIVTEMDLLARPRSGARDSSSPLLELLASAERRPPESVHRTATVREVMSAALVSVDPDTPLEQVLKLMQTHAIKRLPVIEAGRLVGIVSRADLLCALAKVLAVNQVVDAVRATSRSGAKS